MIVLLAGLPGTGKTTLARELATHTRGRVVSKDEIRHSLFTIDEIEYSTRQDDFCLAVMLETVGFLLEQNSQRVVFLDGRTFSRRYQIENVVNAASLQHQTWRILECVCPEEVARKRLQKQTAIHPAGNRDFELYLEVKLRFETITLPKTVIDTNQPMRACVEHALRALR
jgi:predicted kinase